MNESDPSPQSASRFAPTRWSMVVAARDWQNQPLARRAMSELARAYWFPLYAYLRRKGNSPDQAEDLVQGFFAQILENDAIATVDRAHGKFRSFLLASLNHFLSNEWDKSRAQKRGGGRQLVSLDAHRAEEKYSSEPVDAMTPDKLFERRWALAVLEQVLAALRDEYSQAGNEKLFAAMEHLLTGSSGDRLGPIAEKLNMTEGAVKVAAHRLRKRYREILREEIAQTVSDPSAVEGEIKSLLASLG